MLFLFPPHEKSTLPEAPFQEIIGGGVETTIVQALVRFASTQDHNAMLYDYLTSTLGPFFSIGFDFHSLTR
jgi:hypothetical protein